MMPVMSNDSSVLSVLRKRLEVTSPRFAVRSGTKKAVAKLRFDENCRRGGFIFACLVEAFVA